MTTSTKTSDKSVSDWKKEIENVFGKCVGYRAVGPDGSVYMGGDQTYLNRPDTDYVIPFCPARTDSGSGSISTIGTRKRGRK